MHVELPAVPGPARWQLFDAFEVTPVPVSSAQRHPMSEATSQEMSALHGLVPGVGGVALATPHVWPEQSITAVKYNGGET